MNFPKDVYISKEAKDLLKKILVKDPDNRPKIETIKASSFFRNGKGIPKYLPESTMIKPMNRDEEEKFVNDAIFKGECLDKDCDLPDKVANKRSYTERNEMESNFDQDDSSSKTDEEDENKSENAKNESYNGGYFGINNENLIELIDQNNFLILQNNGKNQLSEINHDYMASTKENSDGLQNLEDIDIMERKDNLFYVFKTWVLSSFIKDFNKINKNYHIKIKKENKEKKGKKMNIL